MIYEVTYIFGVKLFLIIPKQATNEKEIISYIITTTGTQTF